MDKRTAIVLKELNRLFPNPKMALDWNTPWELVVAVVLSAQTTDKQVNKVTPALFKKYPALSDYISADLEEFQQDINSIGLFRAKGKNILAAANMLQSEFHGELPDTLAELQTLPGVGRKTANVVLRAHFGKADGIAVDTHVRRLSNKFGLTKSNSPVKIEKDLMAALPKEAWLDFTLQMIEYGRNYSPARAADDDSDPISLALKKANV